MPTKSIFRIAGAALIAGGLYIALVGFSHLIGLALIWIGLYGIQRWESGKTGRLGSYGMVVSAAGILAIALLELILWIAPAALALQFQYLGFLVAGSVVMLGLILFALGFDRAQLPPRYFGGFLILGVILTLLVGLYGPVALGLLFVWTGGLILLDKWPA